MSNQIKHKKKEYMRVEKDFEERRNYVVNFIQFKYRWSRHEADTIYNDACLVALEQLKKGAIKNISSAYIIRICKNLGANNYRKLLTEKERFLDYYNNTKKSYQESVAENYGIELFDSATNNYSSPARQALRAFSMLSKKCQELISMKYIDDESHNYIAENSKHVSTAESSRTVLSRCIKYWRNLNNRILSDET